MKQEFIKKILVGLLAMSSISAFSTEKNPCGIFIAGVDNPKVVKKMVRRLNAKGYEVVSREESTYIVMTEISAASTNGSIWDYGLLFFDTEKEASGDFQGRVFESGMVDTWPIPTPRFYVTHRLLKGLKKIQSCPAKCL